MAHISDFWRLGGSLTPGLWQGSHSIEGTAEGCHSIEGEAEGIEGTAEGSHSIEGEAAGGSHSIEGLPYETMPLGEWLRLPARDMHAATLEWIAALGDRR